MNERLKVRKGFMFGALAGFSVAGSMIWAIPVVSTYLPPYPTESKPMSEAVLPAVRDSIPSEMAWFFIQYPYVTTSAQIKPKNHHTYVVSDSAREKEYVVNFGQRFRRVEIYAKGTTDSQIHVYTPGLKRTVSLKGSLVLSEARYTEPNMWMWKTPLWNQRHLQIFTQVDHWLHSPFKRYSCAGFVSRFLRESDIDVPVLDAWDMAKLPWLRVPIDELEPGDILTMKAVSAQHRRFWGHRITHVGVYIGNGKFIHAATPSRTAKRSWIRIAEIQDFRERIDKALRPPDLL